MCSDGVTDDDTGTAGPAADAVEVATQPASFTANSTSMPSSSQYDASGMTELSLLTDEVIHRRCWHNAFHCHNSDRPHLTRRCERSLPLHMLEQIITGPPMQSVGGGAG